MDYAQDEAEYEEAEANRAKNGAEWVKDTNTYRVVFSNAEMTVTARDAEEAQDVAIEQMEDAGRVHGEVVRIVRTAGVAEFIGMVDVGGEQFAHYRGVAL
jgi:hypothetical protein